MGNNHKLKVITLHAAMVVALLCMVSCAEREAIKPHVSRSVKGMADSTQSGITLNLEEDWKDSVIIEF